MLRNVTMLFLAFAVLFGSVHVTPWSHEHIEANEHSHEMSNDGHHDDDVDLSMGDEQPAKKADVSGDIGHQHSTPSAIEIADSQFDASDTRRQSMPSTSQVTILSSLSRAPPTQPPSA